ncbi:MAG TPA: EamA family transporter [Candidatus Saccharimonadales bacterium]|jgi:drug/metabolite transporter (DMT)-like permease|nr:EamA family transporter [Candidatus Saccharimonadales bacterium]
MTTAISSKQHRFQIALAFALVYVLWGSTYLAMRVAVVHIPPFAMGAVRYLIAGPVMLAWCAWSGRKIRITAQDFWKLLAIAGLLLTVGNMGVAWAEVYVPSGLAALIVAIVPIWVAIIQAWVLRSSRMSWLGLAGLAMGIAGMAVLLWPRITAAGHLGRQEMFGIGLLTLGSLGWALGSVLGGRWNLGVDVFTSSAWQMTFGGIVNLIIALAGRQFQHAHWTVPGVASIIYLIICGSWIGFSAYNWLLEHVATAKVATYAYVNPVVAVYLGWLFLSETLDGFMLAGTAVIVAAVALVNVSKLRGSGKNAPVSERGQALAGPAGD